jgi:diguanylate cyclase (GGDEF)-like protein
VAQALRQVGRRATDLAARYGGEEFAILLPDTDAANAINLAQVLLQKMESLKIPHEDSKVARYVTLSVGVSVYEALGSTGATSSEASNDSPRARPSAAALISAADKALYAAKQAGRNRACFLSVQSLGVPDAIVEIRRSGDHLELPSRPSSAERTRA